MVLTVTTGAEKTEDKQTTKVKLHYVVRKLHKIKCSIKSKLNPHIVVKEDMTVFQCFLPRIFDITYPTIEEVEMNIYILFSDAVYNRLSILLPLVLIRFSLVTPV